MRTLKGADLARRPIAAKFGPEQLDLEPVRPHRRAVDRNKGTLRAPRVQMQQPPDDLLTGAGRAGDQNPAAGRRHSLDLLPQLVGRRRDADEIDVASGAQLQLLVLAPQLRRLDRTLDDQQQPIRFEGFFDEIVGADLDRFDRRLDRTVSADHDDGDRRHLGAQLFEDLDPLEPAFLQPDVEDDERRLPRPGLLPRPERCRQLPAWRSPRP